EDQGLDVVADLDDLRRVHVVLDRQLARGDHTLGLVADVEQDLVPVDLDDGALDNVTIVEVLNGRVDRGEEVGLGSQVVHGDLGVARAGAVGARGGLDAARHVGCCSGRNGCRARGEAPLGLRRAWRHDRTRSLGYAAEMSRRRGPAPYRDTQPTSASSSLPCAQSHRTTHSPGDPGSLAQGDTLRLPERFGYFAWPARLGPGVTPRRPRWSLPRRRLAVRGLIRRYGGKPRETPSGRHRAGRGW